MRNEATIECILCKGFAKLKHNEFPGYQEPDIFQIYHCQNCGTAFSLPRVETDKIYENIYKDKDKVPGYDRYWKYACTIKNSENPLEYLAKSEEAYWGVKEALKLYGKDGKYLKILEIGSGLGYLTYSLIKANFNVIGLDISQNAVNQASNIFGNYFICADLHEYAQLHPEAFDIVILTEVIEHINNPLDFIESVTILLKPGGRAIITTPNKSFYPNNIIWATEAPPVHCWWFGEKSLRYIAERANLTLTIINFSGYYKKRYHAIDMSLLINSQLPTPFFNNKGELMIQNPITKKTLKSNLRLIVAKIPYTKRIYWRLKSISNPNIIVCGDRGTVLCIIMQKYSNTDNSAHSNSDNSVINE